MISDAKLKMILKVFSKLKQRVLMKLDAATVNGKPENVLLGTWLPQDDILAHKNVKLFISHCGLGSVVESKYHGVPILAIPLFADQGMNAESIVNEGWSFMLNSKTMTEDEFTEAIHQLLYNETLVCLMN